LASSASLLAGAAALAAGGVLVAMAAGVSAVLLAAFWQAVSPTAPVNTRASTAPPARVLVIWLAPAFDGTNLAGIITDWTEFLN
jgi:hypothetical protein